MEFVRFLASPRHSSSKLGSALGSHINWNLLVKRIGERIMFNTKSAKFTIDKRYFPRMVSLQQPSHFFGKLLIVAGLEDLNFTFYKIAVHINSCLSDIEYDAFDIGEFGILFCFQRK